MPLQGASRAFNPVEGELTAMTTYISRIDSGLHCVVRLVPTGDGLTPYEGVSDQDAINSLVSAKSINKLLEAIDHLPPLVPSRADGTRYFRVREVAGRVGESFQRYDLGVLLAESAYYSNRAVKTDERGAKIAMDARDVLGGGLEAELAQVIDLGQEDCYRVSVEPLLDWCFARNCAGLILRMVAALQADGSGDILEAVGFKLRENRGLMTNVWTIPLAFNPFFAPRTRFGRDQVEEHSPLLFNATARFEDPNTRIPRWNIGDGGAYLLMPDDPGNDRALHLCIEDPEGRGGGTLAREILGAFWHMVRDLRFRETRNSQATELGWEIAQSGVFDEVPCITILPLSGFSKLLYQSYYRGDQRLAVCRNCGCATLQQNHGRKREFCSDACRAQWVSEGKD